MNYKELNENFNCIDKVEKVKKRTKKNYIFSEWYDDLYESTEGERYLSRANSIRTCCQLWDIDYYRFQGVKDVQRTNLCKSKFCENCGNASAKKREEKFTPLLDYVGKFYDVYHIVFTVPNCKREVLKGILDKMYYEFSYIVRLFRGNAKIKGYDFTKYGFWGAVRALEITKNVKENTFHPHFHCLFVLKKGLKLDKVNKTFLNQYSFSNADVEKKRDGKPYVFSEFEILLQKIWYLRFNDIRVNEKSISELGTGYSVIANNSLGKYHQVFKYATKGVFAGNKSLSGYFDFVALDKSLDKRKIIQGYGNLNRFKFDVNFAFDEEADQAYDEVIAELKNIENPVKVFEFLSDMDFYIKNGVRYISRTGVKNFLSDKRKPIETAPKNGLADVDTGEVYDSVESIPLDRITKVKVTVKPKTALKRICKYKVRYKGYKFRYSVKNQLKPVEKNNKK